MKHRYIWNALLFTLQNNFQVVASLCYRAVNELNGYIYDGSTLKVEFSMERRGRGRGSSRGGAGAGFSGLPGSGRQTDFPLRILVQSDMVGAIIGRQGSTIRQITQQTRARFVYKLVICVVDCV